MTIEEFLASAAMIREEREITRREWEDLARAWAQEQAAPNYPVVRVDRAGVATIEEPRGPWARAWRRRLDERSSSGSAASCAGPR
jgi:hypothetical protein